MKPPFPYFGGKQTLAREIVSLFPDHEHYVEPCAGGLAVLLAKPVSPIETVNDLDGALITFWRVLRDREADLRRALDLTPHARGEMDVARRALVVDGDELETARRVWIRLAQGRGSNLGDQSAGWRYAASPDYGSAARHLDGYRSRVPACARRIRHVSLENRPAVEIVRDYGRHDRVLLYVDPPYVSSTRSKAKRYGHEMTDDDHRMLAATLADAAAAVVVSGYPSSLYDQLYAGWYRAEMSAQTANGGAGRATTEVLWANRPLVRAPALFDLEAS